jgi:hypothetical protein
VQRLIDAEAEARARLGDVRGELGAVVEALRQVDSALAALSSGSDPEEGGEEAEAPPGGPTDAEEGVEPERSPAA